MALTDISPEARQADLLFQVDGAPPDKLRVVSFEGFEALSMLFRYQLELVSEDGSIDFDSIVGKPGLLTVKGAHGTRFVNGIVSRFEQLGKGVGFSTYSAELVPEIWLLALRAKCKIFPPDKTARDVIEQVLEDGGIAKDRYRFSLKANLPTRVYCVQYRESDLNFILRLLEEEGIFFFFEHTEDGHVLVMADNNEATVELEGGATLLFRPRGGGVPSEEHVNAFSMAQDVRSGTAALRDFNYLENTVLEQTKSADNGAELEVYDFPGLFQEVGEGKRLVQSRLEELQVMRRVGHGESSVRRLLPGYRFTLTEFPREDFNGEYLVQEVRASGYQPQSREAETGEVEERPVYRNSFECILSDVPFRPLRITPKPAVRGSQTATVLEPDGSHMDEHGRAKVLFHWNRDAADADAHTCWIRVSQGYAGPTHGIQFPPLAGDEVIVDFLEGDPDRPIITGRVYNGDNKPPLDPGERVQNIILTPYQHRLMLDDKKASLTLNTGGSESLHMGDAAEDSDYGNNVKILTADGHFVQLAKGDVHKGVVVQTEAGHNIEMRDDPDPGIFLVDKEGTIFLHLDTANQTINLINDTSVEINVKCAGGTVNVEAGDIKIDAENTVSIIGGSEISLSAPAIKIDGQSSIEAKAPDVKIEGQASLEAKGAMTTVEASGIGKLKAGGILTIEGTLVKIN